MVGSGWHIIKVKVGLTVRGELLAKVGEVIWHWLVVWVWVIMGGRVGVVLVTSLGLVGRGEQVSGLGLIGRVELVSGLGLVRRVKPDMRIVASTASTLEEPPRKNTL